MHLTKATVLLKSPLTVFLISTFLGYLLAFRIFSHLVCVPFHARAIHAGQQLFTPPAVQQRYWPQAEQHQAPIPTNSYIRTKPPTPSKPPTTTYHTTEHTTSETPTTMPLKSREEVSQEKIASLFQQPHKNLDSKLKIACFVYPTYSGMSFMHTNWLSLCTKEKIMLKSETLNEKLVAKKSDGTAKFSKLRKMVKLYSLHQNNNFDYFLFTNSSSYIIISNLLEYLKNEDDSEAKAYGHPDIVEEGGTEVWSVQGTIVLNRQAMWKVLEALKHHKKNSTIKTSDRNNSSSNSSSNSSNISSSSNNNRNKCSFFSSIPFTKCLMACLAQEGGYLVDTRDHLSKATFLPRFNPSFLLSETLFDYQKQRLSLSPISCQSPSCLSAFPVALHSLNTKELLTIHFLVTWCRYSLFLGNLNDPLVNHQGLIFQGGKLLGVEKARTEEENVEEEIEERRNENDDYENNDEGRNKEE